MIFLPHTKIDVVSATLQNDISITIQHNYIDIPQNDIATLKNNIDTPQKDIGTPQKDIVTSLKDIATTQKDIANPKSDITVTPPKNAGSNTPQPYCYPTELYWTPQKDIAPPQNNLCYHTE